jgi:hypothetical protein
MFRMNHSVDRDYFFKRINFLKQIIFVIVKYGVFFAVRTESLNVIYPNFDFKGLK